MTPLEGPSLIRAMWAHVCRHAPPGGVEELGITRESVMRLIQATSPLIHDGRELLHIDHAAALAKVSRRTIYNWVNKGLVSTRRTASGKLVIYADTLLRPDEVDDVG